MSRTRRATWNYLSALLYTGVTLAVGLAATPHLVQWLTPVRFGAVRVLTEWYGYLACWSWAWAGRCSRCWRGRLGRGDEPALRRAVATGIRAYLKVTLLIVAVGLALVPVIDRLALRPEDRAIVGLVADLRGAWLVSLIGFVPLGLVPFKALVDAGQRGYWINLLLTGQSLLITALALTLARAAGGSPARCWPWRWGCCRRRSCWPGSARGATRACWRRPGRTGPARATAARCGASACRRCW
jgi:hypothetical protein